MPNRLLDFLTSLRLTVVLLFLAMVLVFVGTLAQVSLGLYEAQNRYFRGFFIWWKGFPVAPGGYFLGWALFINLLAAHIRRFTLTPKKIGIYLIHSGLILMLLGQFLTDRLSVEGHMRLVEGESKDYSESSLDTELAVVRTSDPDTDTVVVVPEAMLRSEAEIRHAEIPFTIHVQRYHRNSRLSRRSDDATDPPPASNDIGQSARVEEKPPTGKMEERNAPSAVIELRKGAESFGTWLVSLWLDNPQAVSVDGKTYELTLRPSRQYRPFRIELLDFTHDKYKGTEIPKNFSSRVRIVDPQMKEDREVLIYMNNPLRYRGETFYQGSFDRNDERVSVLQVVKNPSWLTPYFSCVLVGVGLVTQFLIHLIPFVKRRTT